MYFHFAITLMMSHSNYSAFTVMETYVFSEHILADNHFKVSLHCSDTGKFLILYRLFRLRLISGGYFCSSPMLSVVALFFTTLQTLTKIT